MTINARAEEDVEPECIMQKVARASGANYAFHRESGRFQDMGPQAPVVSAAWVGNGVGGLQLPCPDWLHPPWMVYPSWGWASAYLASGPGARSRCRWCPHGRQQWELPLVGQALVGMRSSPRRCLVHRLFGTFLLALCSEALFRGSAVLPEATVPVCPAQPRIGATAEELQVVDGQTHLLASSPGARLRGPVP